MTAWILSSTTIAPIWESPLQREQGSMPRSGNAVGASSTLGLVAALGLLQRGVLQQAWQARQAGRLYCRGPCTLSTLSAKTASRAQWLPPKSLPVCHTHIHTHKEGASTRLCSQSSNELQAGIVCPWTRTAFRTTGAQLQAAGQVLLFAPQASNSRPSPQGPTQHAVDGEARRLCNAPTSGTWGQHIAESIGLTFWGVCEIAARPGLGPVRMRWVYTHVQGVGHCLLV